MKTILPLLVSLAYLIVAIDFATESRWGWALAWFSYSLANVGLVLAANEL